MHLAKALSQPRLPRNLHEWAVRGVLLALGAAQAISLAWPWDFGPERGQALGGLQMLSLAGFVAVLGRSARARQAAWRGWWFAFAWLTCSVAWLYVSMHTYGGLPAWMALFGLAALTGVLALYYALFSWLFWRIALINKALSAIVFAACWTLAELARGQLFTGFGWAAGGYAQVDGVWAAWLPWLGVYGVTALAAGAAAVLAQALGGGWRTRPVWAGVALLGTLALLGPRLPRWPATDTPTLSVALLQGNIEQDIKFDPATGVAQSLWWYRRQLAASEASLTITPETALPVLPDELPEGYAQALQDHFAQGSRAALVGQPLGSYEAGYTNSVLGLRPGAAQPWRYDKHHLVPFGEFVPPSFRWFTELMQMYQGDFSRGPLPQPTFDWAGQRLGVTICYENLFSEEVAALFGGTQPPPTLLVNVSNLGWFGEHLAMDQHLNIARVRALEFDRPFLLATNTGRTAVIDHQARVLAQAPAHQAAVLRASVAGREGLTPYARWAGCWGQWPVVAWALGVIALALLRRPRGAAAGAPNPDA
jgi:apolipoprotein N-acyltransferase